MRVYGVKGNLTEIGYKNGIKEAECNMKNILV
jgi:hypothetical protein